MPPSLHILINGLSIGSGGGYTVARELLRHIGLDQPDWRLTMAMIEGAPMHEPMRQESLPNNCSLYWTPHDNLKRLTRVQYENGQMPRWADQNQIDAVVQLNGMIVPRLTRPTLSHFQNPWPLRSEAWSGLKDRVFAALQRREYVRALRRADCAGFTSRYLQELTCGRLKVQPRRNEVFYNGLPESWLERARTQLPPWDDRPMQLVTVSDVNIYKRQSLVIEALGRLIKRPGCGDVTYRVLGQCPPNYRSRLMALAGQHDVADRVSIEGRVSDEQVIEALTAARCFVLMSVCESFGIPAIEAMTFGTPVVTSDCCAMPEVCGEAAELCPVDDVEALTDRVAQVLTDADHAHDLRRKGALRVAKFRWPDTAAQMARCLTELTNGASK